jgi:hypothetical protein
MIIVFLQRMLKEKLPIFLINTLLLQVPLLALRDRQNDGQRDDVLGHQANLKETSKGKELDKLRLQVLEVGKQVMLVNPKRKL